MKKELTSAEMGQKSHQSQKKKLGMKKYKELQSMKGKLSGEAKRKKNESRHNNI